MKYDVFISYSSKDQKIIEALCHYLEDHNLRCFVAYRDIPKGEDWGTHIPPAIKESKIFIYVHTKNSNKSIFLLNATISPEFKFCILDLMELRISGHIYSK